MNDDYMDSEEPKTHEEACEQVGKMLGGVGLKRISSEEMQPILRGYRARNKNKVALQNAIHGLEHVRLEMHRLYMSDEAATFLYQAWLNGEKLAADKNLPAELAAPWAHIQAADEQLRKLLDAEYQRLEVERLKRELGTVYPTPEAGEGPSFI